MILEIYERKGYLQVKEEGEEKHSKRMFVLLETTLYYYKEGQVNTEVWIIPLQNSTVKFVWDKKHPTFEIYT